MSDTETTRASPARSQGTEVFGGRFHVVAKLGEGGMGVVYEVRDAELGESVALKVLTTSRADEVGRLRGEVRLARRITHRNVVRLFDMGEDRSRYFFTMELVRGKTLRDRLREDRPGKEDALRLAAQIAEGLAAAHAAGVIHRDLKPANVLLGPEGRAVVTDFGISRAVQEGARGEISGTEGYMPPEQREGGRETPAIDVYALGAVLYELLTGERARAGIRLDKVRSASPEMAELVGRCISDDPARRPSSAEVAQALVGRTSPRASAEPLGEPAAPPKAIAVLPPRLLGPDVDRDTAEVLTQEWVDLLTRTRGLRVIGLGATKRFSENRDPLEVGRALGADAVVDTTLRKLGPKIRLEARLNDARDGAQLWSERFEDDPGSMLQVQEVMATRVAETLRVRLATIDNRGSTAPEVLELYLRGRGRLHQFRPIGPDGAVTYLEEAVARAPGFLPARAALATARLRAWYFEGSESSGAAARGAVQACSAAASLLPEAQLAIAFLHHFSAEEAGAVAALARVLGMAPTCSSAHDLLSAIECEGGRIEDGLRRAAHAIELDPLLATAYGTLLTRHGMRGEVEAHDRWMKLARAQGLERAAPVWVSEARIAVWRGDAAALETLVVVAKATHSTVYGAWAAVSEVVSAGSPEAAQRLEAFVESLRSGPARRQSMFHQIAAEAFAARGDVARAQRQIEAAIAFGFIDVDWLAQCPALAPLRGSPAFEASARALEDRVTELWASVPPLPEAHF